MTRSALLLLASVVVSAGTEIRYTIVPVEAGPALPATYSSFAHGVNNSGEVVGYFDTPDLTAYHPFRFSFQTGMVDLGHLGSDIAFALAVNDSGQIAGWGGPAPGEPFQAFRYTTGGGFELLGTLGGISSEARDINNRGQVTGYSTLADGSEHAFRYTDGVGMEDLGPGHIGWGINDSGWVTGAAGANAFLYRDDKGLVTLGPGRGLAINSQGVVAGEYGYPFSSMAVVWGDGQTRFLGTLGGERSLAIGINDHNQVVGGAQRGNGSMVGFVWTEAEGMLDLNSLVDTNSGWFIGQAADVNEAGWIVGDGYFNGKGQGYLLVPIPKLQVERHGTNVVVSWAPSWPGTALEAVSSLSPTNWQPVPTVESNSVTVPVSAGAQFFRVVWRRGANP